MADRTVQDYLFDIEAYEKEFSRFISRGKAIIKRYRDDDGEVPEGKIWDTGRWGQMRFNILWSNVQVLAPAYYSKTPVPESDRKFKDKDPIGKVAAELAERISAHFVEDSRFDEVEHSCVQDLLLPGRAVSWVRYVGRTEPQVDEMGQPVLDEQGEPLMVKVGEEDCFPEYVYWEDFGHNVTRAWKDVTRVWRWQYFDKEEAKEIFGEEMIAEMKFDYVAESDKTTDPNAKNDRAKKARVCELWDKRDKKVYWFEKEKTTEFLKVLDDPLRLKHFFPCPKPLFATLVNGSLVPTADFTQYKSQAEQLDLLVARRELIISAIRVVGCHDSSRSELDRVFRQANELESIPVHDWQGFMQAGGLEGTTNVLQLKPFIETLAVINMSIEQQKAELYEVTGLSEIVRGASDAGGVKTATEQGIKQRSSNNRLEPRRKEVARHACDSMNMLFEVALELYDTEKLIQIASVETMPENMQQVVPQALELLRDDKLRCYRMSLQTDSTYEMNREREQQDRMKAFEVFGQTISNTYEAMKEAPSLAPAMGEMAMFAVRSFRAGRQLEYTIEQSLQQTAQQLAQAKQEESQKGDPEVQAAAQAAEQKAQMDQQKAAMDMQLKQQKQEFDYQLAMRKLQMEREIEEMKIQANYQGEMEKAQVNAAAKVQAEMLKPRTLVAGNNASPRM